MTFPEIDNVANIVARPLTEPVVNTKRSTWYRWDDMPREELHDKLSRRLITGDQLMLAHVYLKKGCVVPKHSHHNEQPTYILQAALRCLRRDAAARSSD